MDGIEAIQATAAHIHILVFLLPPCRCASHHLRLVCYESDSTILDLDQGLNTTGTLVSICQNDKFTFSFLQNTYLGLAQAICSTASTLGFWYIQRYWRIRTKRMVRSLTRFLSREHADINDVQFVVTNVVTILIPLWGMIGIWTNKFG
jgi:hypothetical protein